MATVNDALRDRAIRHAIELGRYGAGLSSRIVSLLNSADADILEKLAGRLSQIEERGFDVGPRTTARLRKLLEEIGALNDAIYGQVHTALVEELSDFAEAEATFHDAALKGALVISLETKLPSPARLRAIVEEAPMEGRLLAHWTEGMAKGRADRMAQAIRLGMVQGESTDAIVRRIKGTQAARYSDGILDISRRSAQSIVRTATTHVSNQAAQQTWKANEHIVKGWQFVSTLDGRTTITCAALSGQVFPIGEGPIPPRHIRCRSISIAVTKSFAELGVEAKDVPPDKRASMDGQVAGDTTFAEWLNDKGAGTQDTILGPTRGKLFRDGKLNLSDFIKADGTVLTLDQLKARYPELLA
jgi:SPP1 gp7 family putative phage head morphogenesis protein